MDERFEVEKTTLRTAPGLMCCYNIAIIDDERLLRLLNITWMYTNWKGASAQSAAT
jgi:hypothetical protein